MDGVAEEEAIELLFLTWVSGSLLLLMKAFEFLLSKAGDGDTPRHLTKNGKKKMYYKVRAVVRNKRI